MSNQKYIKAYLENVEGKMVAIASDDSIDRHGESIKQTGWDLVNFKKNPVLQWAHDYSIPPIGRANAIRVEGSKLVFEPEFHDETQLAKEIKALYEKGYLKAFSVGFIPKEYDEKSGVIGGAELLEISGVPVPANGNALIVAKSMESVAKYFEVKEETPKEKSAPCRMDDETKEDGRGQDQAGAIASSICEKECEEKGCKRCKELELQLEEINKGREKAQKEIARIQPIKKALQKIAKNSCFALNKLKRKD